ncbi:MAG: CDP-alcohol phosphatidyltransferase family protein [Thermoprotei archaeon]|nr:CDP-alcohol phosphatidyltransferase family protein [Thermoprotei archaeon]
MGFEGSYVRVGAALSRLGVHPNYYTIAGLTLAVTVPAAAYMGFKILALFLMALSALLDALDGLVARASGLQSRRGAFLDSVSDRISDAAYILALHYMGVGVLLSYTLLVASYMVSYTRARGEGLGVTLKGVGLVERQERVVGLLAAGLASLYSVGLAEAIIAVLLVLSIATLVQRFHRVWLELGGGGG